MRIRIHVEGRVQKVGFRYYARREAALLFLKGFAKNNADGSVTVEAQGEEEDVKNYIERIKLGPIESRVDRCEWQEIEEVPTQGFEVR